MLSCLKKLIYVSVLIVVTCYSGPVRAGAYDIGVYYFPGWNATSDYWNDLQGLVGSRSSGIPWPDREPLLGFKYPEGETWVAEKHIEWASRYGVSFFAYDWYWDGAKPSLEHALKAYLRAGNRNKLNFCLLWANHSGIPHSIQEFDDMVAYWTSNYFSVPSYYKIDGKPLIFIFSNDLLDQNARTFGETAKSLLARADAMAKAKGLKGIYFVQTTNDRPSNALERKILDQGYNAYTGWNYVTAKDKSIIADYSSMVNTYLEFYTDAAKTDKVLPYIVPASPGWDSRPWKNNKPFVYVRENPTPEKFERMLAGAKNLMDTQPGIPKILMIEAWNEFGEGAYIEPTKKWGMRYLETIRKVFGPGGTKL